MYIVHAWNQGYNARKVILKVCASFVLQCTVSVNTRRIFYILQCTVSVNTRRMSQPDIGYIFNIKKSKKYSGQSIGNCN